VKKIAKVLSIVCLAVGATGLILIFAAAAINRVSPMQFPTAMAAFRFGIYVLLVAGIVAFPTSIFNLFVQKNLRAVIAFALLLASVFSVYQAQSLKNKAKALPRIHDISTDTEDPPKFQAVEALRQGAAVNDLKFDPQNIPLQKEAYPEVQPVFLALPRGQAFELALKTARDMSWKIIHHSESEGLIEATDTTLFFGFKDDVAVRLRQQDQQTRIDVRSVSRVGLSDIGANAARILAYLEKLKAASRGSMP